MRSSAKSQSFSSHTTLPGARYITFVNRRSLTMFCFSVMPFGQSVPWLMGWSGSPSTCTTVGVTLRDRSPRVWMITPQLTEQYGQVDRVSVVREIFSSRTAA